MLRELQRSEHDLRRWAAVLPMVEPLRPQGYSSDDSAASARLPPILAFATYGACRVLSTTPDSQASAPVPGDV